MLVWCVQSADELTKKVTYVINFKMVFNAHIRHEKIQIRDAVYNGLLLQIERIKGMNCAA